MDYLVIGSDGKEYGPVNAAEMQEWVRQDRVRPTTQMKDFHTGRVMAANEIPNLFGGAPPSVAGANWSQPPAPPSPYPRAYTPQTFQSTDDGKGVMLGVIFRSALAIFFFFVFHGIGLIVAGYALFYAIRSKAVGHRFGIVSVVIASLTFLVILIGWILRFASGGQI